MDRLMDYNGLRKAWRHGWKLVYIRTDNFKIIGGETVEPNHPLVSDRVVLMSIKDYRWMTDYYNKYLPKETRTILLSDWYDMVDFNKLLKLCNLHC